ncbi:hypothetical protein WDH52_11845 [Streptomyces sp. TRM70308]|uniref:hypothetical protein n=1 Tax=Streptomyces sp. TRM70308 TaxID=3131932 RepID=UPI003D00493C
MSGEDARDAERGRSGDGASPAPGGAPSPSAPSSATPPGAGPGGTLPEKAARHRFLGRRRRAEATPGDAAARGRLRAFAGGVADRLIQTAPRIPARSLAALREQFPGKGPEEIADALVATAMKGSATVGAGVGAAAMLPVPPAMPAELTAEIVGVASVELKLIAELHELYGLRPPGNARQRAAAYLTSWAHQRGVDPLAPATLNAALGGQLRRELRQRLLKRTLRNLPNLAPFMIGAVVGAAMNRRETRKLADDVRADLRRRQVPWDRLPPAAQRAADAPSPSADTSR